MPHSCTPFPIAVHLSPHSRTPLYPIAVHLSPHSRTPLSLEGIYLQWVLASLKFLKMLNKTTTLIDVQSYRHFGLARQRFTTGTVACTAPTNIGLFHIPPNLVVECVPTHRKPPEVRICRLSIQSGVGTRPPSTSTPHWPACCARR